MKGVRVRVLCDVGNPLWGLNGAARVYAPQKGASPQEVALLEQGLKRLARHASWAEAQAPGAGAAGGLGFGLEAFVGARREPGARALLDWVGFEGRARRADWIVTGEGCLDRQTLAGKLPAVVAERARILGRPCAVFAGALELPPATLRKAGWTAWRSAPALRPKAAALALEKAAEAWGRECSGPALVGIPKMS
jgi:glycerate kinase